MKNNSFKDLSFRQFCRKMDKITEFKHIFMPQDGWISYLRTSINMKQNQLGKKLNITQPGVKFLEKSEKEGGITLASLRKTADVFDCDLVYAFKPRKDMKSFIEKNAIEAAKKELLAVDHTMALENQSLSMQGKKSEIKDYAKELKNNLHKKLWD